MTWREVRLRRLVVSTNGSWGSEPDEGDMAARCLRGTDFDYELLRTTVDRAPMRGFSRSEFRDRCARRGDLIVEKSGGGEQQPVGRVVLHDIDEPVVPTNFAGRLRPHSDVDSRFLCYLMASLYFDGRTTAAVKQTTGIQNLDLGSWLDNRVLIPGPTAQRAIADFLDAETARIDALITKKRQLVELMTERRTALTDSAILSARGPSRPVAVLARYENGWPFKPSDFSDRGLPVVRIQQLLDPNASCDFYDGELPARVRLSNGDLVFTWSGSLAVRWWDRGEAYLNQHLFKVTPMDGVEKRWLRFALDAATRLFAPFMHGSAMTHITQPMMKAVRLPLPAAEDQEGIAEALTREWSLISDVVERIERQLMLLAEHRQALITAAVTGELEVPGVTA